MALKLSNLFVLFFSVFGFQSLYCQVETDTSYRDTNVISYWDANKEINKPVEVELNQDEWKNRSATIDYKDSTKKRDTTNFKLSSPKGKRKQTSKIPDVLIYIVLAIAVVVLLFLILKKGRFNKRNKAIELTDPTTIDEHNIDEIEFDVLQKEALRIGDHALAFRYGYLNVLKGLRSKNLIFYKKERTNFEYLNQLTGTEFSEPFGQLTLQFDKTWYGDYPMDQSTYDAVQPVFDQIKNALTTR
ncbi:MAG TPA: DUF4129 domain-containing protein [Bacteroidia bacterium]